MFRSDLKEKLSKIFGMQKTTFDAPSESHEQDSLFIEIEECQSRTGEGSASARVTGSIVVFSQDNKLPYGFFNKRLQQAKPEHTKDLFFFDIDVDALNSPARIQNISERRAKFVYLYSAQYDPNQGSLTSLEFEEA